MLNFFSLRLSPIVLSALDHFICDGNSQLPTGDDVTPVMNAAPDPPLRGPLASTWSDSASRGNR
jgi:hypothetical protein